MRILIALTYYSPYTSGLTVYAERLAESLDRLFAARFNPRHLLDAVESMNQQSFSTQDLSIPRKNGCFPTAQQFTSGIGNPQVQSAVQTHLNMRSSWFRLRTNIRIGTAEFVLYSVLFREQNNQVRTVRRSFGSE